MSFMNQSTKGSDPPEPHSAGHGFAEAEGADHIEDSENLVDEPTSHALVAAAGRIREMIDPLTPFPFIQKLRDIMSDDRSAGAIEFGGDGKSIIIEDSGRFTEDILPLYFKHRNLPSFIRQLNIYGFHKASHSLLHFSHPYFIRNRPELLTKIARRRTSGFHNYQHANQMDTKDSYPMHHTETTSYTENGAIKKTTNKNERGEKRRSSPSMSPDESPSPSPKARSLNSPFPGSPQEDLEKEGQPHDSKVSQLAASFRDLHSQKEKIQRSYDRIKEGLLKASQEMGVLNNMQDVVQANVDKIVTHLHKIVPIDILNQIKGTHHLTGPTSSQKTRPFAIPEERTPVFSFVHPLRTTSTDGDGPRQRHTNHNHREERLASNTDNMNTNGSTNTATDASLIGKMKGTKPNASSTKKQHFPVHVPVPVSVHSPIPKRKQDPSIPTTKGAPIQKWHGFKHGHTYQQPVEHDISVMSSISPSAAQVAAEMSQFMWTPPVPKRPNGVLKHSMGMSQEKDISRKAFFV